MSKEDIVNIYWAPAYDVIDYSTNKKVDWSMIYPDPKNLFNNLSKEKRKDSGEVSLFSCPATKNFLKTVYAFQSAMSSEYFYDFSNNNKTVKTISKEFVGIEHVHNDSINAGPLLKISLGYIFFADKPLVATFTAPFFSNSEYTQYGTPVPGEFDIGQWFRPFSIELQMWNNSGKLKINAEEDLFYVRFNTKQNVKLHRFNMNEKLESHMYHCINYKNMFGPFRPLAERYVSFKNARLKDSILKEINENLIGESDE
jgi:hypothetical protein